MSLVLFYFSGTGNTRYVAKRVCATLIDHGYDAKAVSIENLNTLDAQIMIDNATAVGLGWPIYGSDVPTIMKSFIKAMPIVEKKPLLTFCTQLAFSGDGAVVMRHQLESKGYVQKWAMQINMPNNVSVRGIPLSCSKDYSQLEKKYLKTARKRADYLAFKVLKNVEDIRGASIFHTLAAMSQRPFFKYGGHSFLAKRIGVNKRCNGCQICMKMCSKSVIKMVNGKATHSNPKECTVCFRCVNFCPCEATTVFNKVKTPLYRGPDKETYKYIMKNKKA